MFFLLVNEITIWRLSQRKSKIGWSQSDGNTDKEKLTLKDIMKSLCKIAKPMQSINRIRKLENISKMLTKIDNKQQKG